MRVTDSALPCLLPRKKRGNRGSSGANGGVSSQQAEEEKVPNAVSVDTYILFLFRLSNKARQNRTFAKRYLERGDCLSRSPAEHRRGEFLRVTDSALPCLLPRKKRGNRGSSGANGGVSSQQAEEEKVRKVINFRTFILFLFRLSNKARQNRTFGKRYLERGDCLSNRKR